MARDIFIALDRCHYCGRPGFVAWDVDLFTCGRETCESLAFAEVQHRNRHGGELPEKKLAKALLASLGTFERELRLDRDAGVIEDAEARRIGEREREETAHVLSDLRELARRHPPPRAPRRRPRAAPA